MIDDLQRPHPRRTWAALVAIHAAVLVSALAFTGPAAAQEGSEADASPSASGAVLPGEPNPPRDDGALPASIDPNLVNVRPRTWEHVIVAPDGRTLTVYFSSGPPDCYGLADVQVTQREAEVGIELWVGEVPGAPVCAEIVQLYRTVVVLDERVLTGGSLLDLPSG